VTKTDLQKKRAELKGRVVELLSSEQQLQDQIGVAQQRISALVVERLKVLGQIELIEQQLKEQAIEKSENEGKG